MAVCGEVAALGGAFFGARVGVLGGELSGSEAGALGGAPFGGELGALGGSAPSAGGAWSELERLDPGLGSVVILGTSCTCMGTPHLPYFDPGQSAVHGQDAQM